MDLEQKILLVSVDGDSHCSDVASFKASIELIHFRGILEDLEEFGQDRDPVRISQCFLNKVKSLCPLFVIIPLFLKFLKFSLLPAKFFHLYMGI